MPACPQRERLIVEWNEAVLKFSKSIRRLKAAIEDGDFADQHRAIELARQHAENALNDSTTLPRRTHNC
jgi:hypothetical protein